MNKQARSRKFTAKQSARLGAYLAAGLGASTVATSSSDAAIVNINIVSFGMGGVNAGVSSGQSRYVYNFPFSGAGDVVLINGATGMVGLYGSSQLGFAINGGYASPRNFSLNIAIGSTATFASSDTFRSVFRDGPYVSPSFDPGSFMGFRTAEGNYGWLEVTWDSKALPSGQFQILSGAYEDQVGVAILAGQGAAPIPEPGTWVAMAVFAGGAAFARWRKRRDEAPQEAA